jgi:hypothetical protein
VCHRAMLCYSIVVPKLAQMMVSGWHWYVSACCSSADQKRGTALHAATGNVTQHSGTAPMCIGSILNHVCNLCPTGVPRLFDLVNVSDSKLKLAFW